MYVGLAARVAGFRRDDLTRALERRRAVQGTLQRATIHLVSARDYWPFALAAREARRRWWLRGRPDAEAPVVTAVERLSERLRIAGQLTRAELAAVVGPDLIGGVGLWLDLIRVPPSGTWDRRRADVFALAGSWVGPPAVSEHAAVELVVRRYLAGFGPAPPKDIAHWAGLPVGLVHETLARLTLRRFRDEDGRELVDLPRAPLPDPDTPAPVRFLPTYDAVLLGHARRAGVLPERYRSMIFSSRQPQSVPTFTGDGAVAGTWRHVDGRVLVSPFEPFEPLDDETAAAVTAEAERVGALHA